MPIKKDEITLEETIKRLIKIGATEKFLKRLPIFSREMASSSYDLVRVSVINAILRSRDASGLSHEAWKQSLDVKGLQNLAKSQIRTAYRTTLIGQYNQGHYEQGIDSEDPRFFLYDAINDTRTRPGHEALDGVVKKATDNFWRTHTPPLGFNCRCVLRTLTKDRAAARAEREGRSRITTSGNDLKTKVKEIADREGVKQNSINPGADKGFNPRNPQKPLEFLDKSLKEQVDKLPAGLKAPFNESLRRRSAEAKAWFEKNKDKFTNN